MLLLAVLSSLLLTAYQAVTVTVTKYSLTFNGDNCAIGQNLTIGSSKHEYTLCDIPNQEQLNLICQSLADSENSCKADTGLVTSGGENDATSPLFINTTYIKFKAGCVHPVMIVCYNVGSQCLLPDTIPNGNISLSTSGEPLDLTSERIVSLDDVVSLACEPGYMSYYSSEVPCKQVKTAKLEWSLECIRIEAYRKMKMIALVDNTIDLGKLTSDWSYCIEVTLVSLFTQAISTYNIPDLLDNVNARPGMKRALSTTPSIRIDQLTILYDESNAIGIIIDFYVVFFKSVLTPDRLTKLFDSLSVDQYNMTLQYACTSSCPDSKETCNPPSMSYASKPRPVEACLFNGTTYSYGDQIELSCGEGRYIKEQQTTYCLYGQFTSPPEYPSCGECGSTMTDYVGKISPPQRESLMPVRGGHCTWKIRLSNNMHAWFNYPIDGSVNCSSFLTLREMDPNSPDTVLRTHQLQCVGRSQKYSNLSSHIDLVFVSNDVSDASRAFQFEYSMIQPTKNWVIQYQTPIVIAATILVVLIGLVILGLYCDWHNKRDKLNNKVDVSMRNVEVNDDVSDSTMKPQTTTMFNKRKELCDEAPLNPQPRKPKKKKKKVRKVAPGEDNPGVEVMDGSPKADDAVWTTRNGNHNASSLRALPELAEPVKRSRPLPPVDSEEELPRQEDYHYTSLNIPTDTTFQPRNDNYDLETSNHRPFQPNTLFQPDSDPETLEPISKALPVTNTFAARRDDHLNTFAANRDEMMKTQDSYGDTLNSTVTAVTVNPVAKLHESNGGHSVTFKDEIPIPAPSPVKKKRRRKKKVLPDERKLPDLAPMNGAPPVERRPLPSIPPVHSSIPGGDID